MQVRWTPSALADLDNIQDFVARDSPLAAHRLARELTTRVRETLTQFPDSGRPGLIAGTREFVFGRRPYIVVYRVTDMIEILAVMHMARDRAPRI